MPWRPPRLIFIAIAVAVLGEACADPATEARMRGNVHMRAGEVSKALAAYQEAVKLAPANGQARQLLANALQESGQGAQAQAEYRQAIELSHPASTVGVTLFTVTNSRPLEQPPSSSQTSTSTV